MKWLTRLIERRAEKRRDPSWDALRLHPANASVDTSKAEGIATLYACVQSIASAIASLPALIYRREGTTRVEAPDHELAALIVQGPNRNQTWPEFVEWWLASALLRGNGLAEITREGELLPIPWDFVSVRLLPSGRLAYDVSDLTSLYGGTGRRRTLLDTEVLHLKDRSDDGLIGRSRLSRAAASVGAVVSTQEFAAALYENGAFPSGVLQHPQKLSPGAYERLRQDWATKYAAVTNAGRPAILEEGLTWQSISMSAEDAQLLASRKFGAEEIARIYQVPPPLAGIFEHSSFTNSETAGRWFATHTLAPWCRKVEAEVRRKLLGTDAELEIDLSGLLRGSPVERWQTYDIASKHSILTANEIREQEGWNPRPGQTSPSADHS